jgi:hypothetical protein
MTFFQNGGGWYVQTEEGIWRVKEGIGKRFSLVVETFHKFKEPKEAHGGGTKKSTKN